MTQQLTKMEIDRVDLVDAGANGRRFALFKRAGEPEGPSPLRGINGWGPGIVAKIADGVAKALGIPESVEKAMTFAQIVAGREISQALEEHWYTLQDALWSAIYAVDDDGADLSLEAKKALVGQNLDEFKAFLLERMDAGVTKGAGSADGRLFAAFIAKVGRKISGARMAQLKEAADALAAVLADVEADGESAETKKRATPQQEEIDDMTPEELSAAIAKGNEPLVARIEALEKAQKTPVTKADGDGGDDDDEDDVPAGIVKILEPLIDRVAKLETAPGARTSATGEGAATPVTKSRWAGVLGH